MLLKLLIVLELSQNYILEISDIYLANVVQKCDFKNETISNLLIHFLNNSVY